MSKTKETARRAPKRTKTESRQRMTRSMMYRLDRLHAIFQEQWRHGGEDLPYVSCGRLAELLEVSESTIARDIEFLRDTHGVPLEYSARRRGWGYTEEVTHLPTMQFSEGELLGLCAAMRAMEPYRNTPFEQRMRSAIEKLTAGLRERMDLDLAALENAITFRSTGVQSYVDPAVFEMLIHAILEGAELEFAYDQLHEERTGPKRDRRVAPRLLACIDNGWYLFAHDFERTAIRRFALSRMEEIQRTGRRFAAPEAFDLERELEHTLGVYGGAETEVRVWFSGKAARLVSERQWHASQRITRLEGGAIEFSARVAHTPELESWILRWSGGVEAIEPEPLREAVIRAAQTMLERLTQSASAGGGDGDGGSRKKSEKRS